MPISLLQFYVLWKSQALDRWTLIFAKTDCQPSGGLFWILSDSNVSFDGQSSFFPGFVKYDFAAYLVFISSIRVDPGPRNRGPTSLLALKIHTAVAIMGKLRSIGQVPVVKTSFRIRYELHIMLCDLLAHLTQRIVVSYIQASASISVGIHKFDKLLHFNFLWNNLVNWNQTL